MILFRSEIVSSDNVRFRIDFDLSSYEGINAAIIGGSGSTFYLHKNWLDYLTIGQAILIDDVATNINSFSYNSVDDRTEIVSSTLTYSSQVELKNDVDSMGNYIPLFNPVLIDLHTEWDGQNDIIINPLKTSFTDVVYSDKDTTIDGYEFFYRFVEGWNERNDTQARLVIYKVNGGSYDLEWVGNIVPDLLEWANESSPRAYTFRAEDGINLLKTVDYQGDIDNLNTEKVIDVIKDVLSFTELQDIWGSSDPYIRESIEYETTQIVGVNDNYSPLNYTYVPENLFVDIQKENERQFISLYDVLKGLVSLFSARIFHAKGVYWIQQVRSYDRTTSYTYREFTLANNTTTKSVVYHKQTLNPLAGGKFGSLEGYRSVWSNQKRHYEIKTSNSNSYLGEIGLNSGGVQYQPTISFDLGNISGGVGSGANLLVKCRFRERTKNTRLVVKVAITSGNKYIKNTATLAPYWAEDLIAIDRYWYKVIQPAGAGTDTTLKFETPEIPFDMPNTTLTITFDLLTGTFSSGLAGSYYGVYDAEVYSAAEDVYDSYVKLEVDNPSSNYTKKLELDSLIVTENSNVTSVNTLSIDENFVSGGSVSLVESTTWEGGFDSDDVLSILRIQEAMSLQYRAVGKYTGTFQGSYYPYQSINYDGKVYVMNGHRYHYGMDEYSGLWFEIINVKTGYTPIEYGLGGGIGGGEDGSGSGAGTSLRTYIDQNSLGISGIITGGTITAIPYESIDYERIREGDTVSILSEVTKEELGFFVVDTTPSSGESSLSVTSKSIDNTIPQGSIIQFKAQDTIDTSVVHIEELAIKDFKSVPTTLLEGQLVFTDDSIYFDNGTNLIQIQGEIVL